MSPRPRSWREWFVPDEDTPATHEQAEQVDVISGARHRDFKHLQLKKPIPPRCAKCKRFMGFDDGMFIILSGEWRIHIRCFSEVLERHFEKGEAIDLTTGNIVRIGEDSGQTTD